MTGTEYEQFVRAVLCRMLDITSEQLKSTHASGVTLPNAADIEHQIDLFYVEETEVAEYVTIIECKYRGSKLVDQGLLQNLAFVRDNIRAHKAIMVTNKGFTRGAKALAESQRVALVVIEPHLDSVPTPANDEIEALFDAIQTQLDSVPDGYNVQVVQKLHGDGEDGARDLVAGLLANPDVRRQASQLLNDPNVRESARKLASDNPDLAKKARDFFRKKPW